MVRRRWRGGGCIFECLWKSLGWTGGRVVLGVMVFVGSV